MNLDNFSLRWFWTGTILTLLIFTTTLGEEVHGTTYENKLIAYTYGVDIDILIWGGSLLCGIAFGLQNDSPIIIRELGDSKEEP